MQADWSNRHTTSHAGWVNELLTLADNPNRDIPRFARDAMRMIAHGLAEHHSAALQAAHGGPAEGPEYAKEGQWWLKDLDALAEHNDNVKLKRAVVGVVRKLMREHTMMLDMLNGRPVLPTVVSRFERGQWWLTELEAAVAASRPKQPRMAMLIVYRLMEEHAHMAGQVGATYDTD